MIFAKKKNLDIDVKITINGVALTQVHEIKFLGVVLTDDLKWRKHSDKVVNKISKIVGILRRISHILDADKLKLLYHTLLEPHLIYCCSVWSSPYRTGNLDWILSCRKLLLELSLTHLIYLIRILYSAP